MRANPTTSRRSGFNGARGGTNVPNGPRRRRGACARNLLFVRSRVVFPGTLHLVRPVLVAGPGVEILGDRGVAPARALHALEPGGVCVTAYWRRAVRDIPASV